MHYSQFHSLNHNGFSLRFLCPLFVFLALLTPALNAESIGQPILDRYAELLNQDTAPNQSEALASAKALTENNNWDDIDYKGQRKTSWAVTGHLDRIIAMLRALKVYTYTTEEAENIQSSIERAIDHWLAHRYQSPNWYQNEITVPKGMRDIAVLMGSSLSGNRREGVLEVMNQYETKGTGANLAWSAELGFHYGCLTNDRNLMDQASLRIWEEIYIDQYEGVQSDGSFFQHGARVQNFVYGKGFADVIIKLAWQLRGTDWAMPNEKQSIINTFLLDGCQWMTRNRKNSPIGIDRAVTRRSGFDTADMLSILKPWREIANARLVEIDTYIAQLEGNADPLIGFRYFAQGDLATYHQPTGSIFLKTLSDRTKITESFIGVNLLGSLYLTCGDHYLLRDGNEYKGMPPVWDWKQLPGVTTPVYHSVPVSKPFVGGLSNGISGCAAMDLTRSGDAGLLTVRKFWTFHNGVMICLIGGWDVTTFWGQITTGMEQSRLEGPVLVSKNGQIESIGSESYANLGVDWAIHNGAGYLPLNPDESIIRIGSQSGDWRRIDRDLPPQPLIESTFRIALEHTHNPKPSGYALVIDADTKKMEQLRSNPAWEIIRNDQSAQIIRFDDGRYMGAFYAQTPTGNSSLIHVSQPCILIWNDQSIQACDPTHRGHQLEVTFDNQTLQFDLPKNGTSMSRSWY